MPDSMVGGSNGSRIAELQEDAPNGNDAGPGSSLSSESSTHREHAETKPVSSPRSTPPTDPFPAFEITASIPVTNGYTNGQDAINGEEGAGTSSDNEKEYLSSSGTSTNSNGNSSSSAIEETAPPPSSDAGAETTKSSTQSPVKKEASDTIRKLSASQMQALTSSPESLPVAVVPPLPTPQRKPYGNEYPMSASCLENGPRPSLADQLQNGLHINVPSDKSPVPSARTQPEPSRTQNLAEANAAAFRTIPKSHRPTAMSRTVSTSSINRKASASISNTSLTAPPSARRNSYNTGARPPPLNLSGSSNLAPVPQRAPIPHRNDDLEPVEDIDSPPPPLQSSIPLPPMSLHTHLQLELAGVRPSPLYIYRHQTSDMPYESSAVKFERLLNALFLPWHLESTLTFGALACLDAFLYTFTLLPMRFCIAVGILVKWWGNTMWKESKWVVGYVWQGIGRLWRRGRRGRTTSRSSRNKTDSSQAPSEAEQSHSRVRENDYGSDSTVTSISDGTPRLKASGIMHPPKHAMPRSIPTSFRHRRTKSIPSDLTSYHKADLLQGAVIVCSSLALMNIDASRMYHFIRAQSAMKLYVIYNLLEVGDRLLAAIGQDILECLFSSETLSRNSSGRSKILLPFGMFILSLVYNVVHATCLFYQVITLNVAVNSYSNALLTLIMSNQFVEIKGSVFKKIEKENLFQLTCSDVVERFQLWIILIIIGMRNIVEVGGISVPGAGSEADGGGSGPGPLHTASILPASFTIIPAWFMSGEVLSPFLVVIGSEMLVDWIKHAYVNKFNNVKPTIYRRMLDIFCKDYYTNAFGAPALTRRIGLPLLPLSCLFIRASVQIYNMFLSTRLPPPIPPTSTTELALESQTPSSSSPAMMAALDHLDSLIRNALGRAVYGYPYANPHVRPFWAFTSDDAIAAVTMIVFFFLAWVVLLVVKLLLGMALLKYARERYAAVRLQELAAQQQNANVNQKKESYYQPGKRVGGWGQVEVGDERRRVIYADDPDGLKRMRDRERKGEDMAKKMNAGEDGLEKVTRYEMIAKRIW